MTTIGKRLEVLEHVRRKNRAPGPAYLQFKDQAEYDAWEATYNGPPIKTYVGCGPDDWPDPPTPTRQRGDAGRAAI